MIVHDDHFPETTPDTAWISFVRMKGWVILSKDNGIEKNPMEVKALIEARVHCFLFRSGNCVGAQIAEGFIAAMPQIKELVARHAPPTLWGVTKDGRLTGFVGYEKMVRRLLG